MARNDPLIGRLVAWTAVGIVAVVAGLSLPIDDFWLTLASGRAIAAGAPVAEPLAFSWTPEVADALNPQWLAQLVLGAHGSLGVALLVNALLIGGGVGLVVLRASWRAPAIAACVALLLTMVALAPHLLARAQSFSILLFPLCLVVLDRAAGRPWQPLVLAALFALWANLHGAFVVGQLAVGIWFLVALVQGRHRGLAATSFVAAMVTPIANPAGIELLRYAYGQQATDVVTAISVEWQPSWPWIAVATPFWVLLVAWVAGRIMRRGGAPLADILLTAATAVLAISAIRHIPWFLLAFMPTLAGDVETALDRLPRLRRALGSAPQALARPGTLVAIAVAVAVLQLLRPSFPAGIARLTNDEPVAAVDVLEAEVADGDRVLNEQVWGGYVAYRLWPRLETAMDGRLELRSAATWTGFFDLMHGDGDVEARLRDAGVRWTLISPDREALRDVLTNAGWEIRHDDGYALLLERGD